MSEPRMDNKLAIAISEYRTCFCEESGKTGVCERPGEGWRSQYNGFIHGEGPSYAFRRALIAEYELNLCPGTMDPIRRILFDRANGRFRWRCNRCGKMVNGRAKLACTECKFCSTKKKGTLQDILREEFGIGEREDVIKALKRSLKKATDEYQAAKKAAKLSKWKDKVDAHFDKIDRWFDKDDAKKALEFEVTPKLDWVIMNMTNSTVDRVADLERALAEEARAECSSELRLTEWESSLIKEKSEISGAHRNAKLRSQIAERSQNLNSH